RRHARRASGDDGRERLVGVGAVWTADMHRELVTTLAASRVSANLTGGGGLGHWRRRVLVIPHLFLIDASSIATICPFGRKGRPSVMRL
ncbi:MAG: hypothetical protein WA781_19215, partial [Pseudolabrys sp.]